MERLKNEFYIVKKNNQFGMARHDEHGAIDYVILPEFASIAELHFFVVSLMPAFAKNVIECDQNDLVKEDETGTS